jgi:hypothetical protein
LRGHAFCCEQEEEMLDAFKKALGLDEEGKKRREKAREKVLKEERRERAERVRQEAELSKKYAK